MNLLEIIRGILNIYGHGSDAFVSWVRDLMARGSLPSDVQDQVVAWLIENLGIDEARAQAMAGLIVFEMRSGNPGFDPGHGGIA